MRCHLESRRRRETSQLQFPLSRATRRTLPEHAQCFAEAVGPIVRSLGALRQPRDDNAFIESWH